MSMLASIRVSGACGIVLLAAVTVAWPAAAQELVVNQNGSTSINSNNAGDVTLHGEVTNPNVTGINNSAGTMTALGASSAYSINETNLNAAGEETRLYTAHVSDVASSGTNSGSVNVRGSISGGSFGGTNNSQTISATGLSNVISIRTTARN